MVAMTVYGPRLYLDEADLEESLGENHIHSPPPTLIAVLIK